MSTFVPDPPQGGSAPVAGGFATPSLDRALAAEEREDPLPAKEPLSAGDAVIAAEFARIRSVLDGMAQRLAAVERAAVASQRTDLTSIDGALVDRVELEVALVRLRGAEERCGILFEAKNHWAERARRAEARLATPTSGGRLTEDETIGLRSAREERAACAKLAEIEAKKSGCCHCADVARAILARGAA